MKIVKSLEDSRLLIKCITQTTENETKEQRSGFLSVVLGAIGANIFGNLSAGRAGQDF